MGRSMRTLNRAIALLGLYCTAFLLGSAALSVAYGLQAPARAELPR